MSSDDLAAAVADWEIRPASWQTPRPRSLAWSNHRAGDLMEAVYRAGGSIRQAAEASGFGYEWTRRVLDDRGVLRRTNDPRRRLHLRRDEEGAVRWGYEVSMADEDGRPAGEPAWTVTMFGMPTVREVLLHVGAIDGEKPRRGWLPSSRAFTMPTGLPSVVKLMSADGWWISREECAAAVHAGLLVPPEGGLEALVRRVLVEGGWASGEDEVARRLVDVKTLAGLLYTAGRDGSHGLIVA